MSVEPEELLPKPMSSEQRNYVVTACTVDTQLPTHVRTYVRTYHTSSAAGACDVNCISGLWLNIDSVNSLSSAVAQQL